MDYVSLWYSFCAKICTHTMDWRPTETHNLIEGIRPVRETVSAAVGICPKHGYKAFLEPSLR